MPVMLLTVESLSNVLLETEQGATVDSAQLGVLECRRREFFNNSEGRITTNKQKHTQKVRNHTLPYLVSSQHSGVP